MHISEGVLSPAILIGGAAAAAAGVAVGLKNLDQNDIPTLGILSAAFFVGTLIHVPVGPVSAHLVLNGMVGLLLGWKAFPAVLIGTALQALLFQYGGITTLGVNTIIMALPAVFCYLVFGPLINKGPRTASVAAFTCGAVSVLFSAIMVGLSLVFTEDSFLEISGLVVAAHVPVMIIEGIVTTVCVAFLKRVRPEMLISFAGR